jgi:hypothetical protein
MSEDIAAIVNTINVYPIAVDSEQWDLFDLVFTADVRCGFGGPAAWSDLAALKAGFAAIHAQFDGTRHVTTNHQVAVDGDTAHAIAYVHGRFVKTRTEGGDLFESTGWYEDRLIRTAAGWRIATRNCLMDWWGGNPAVLAAATGASPAEVLTTLKAEAKAGRVAQLRALRG